MPMPLSTLRVVFRVPSAQHRSKIFLLVLILPSTCEKSPATMFEEPMRSIRSFIALTAAARPSNRPSDRLHWCVYGSLQQTKKPGSGLTLRPE